MKNSEKQLLNYLDNRIKAGKNVLQVTPAQLQERYLDFYMAGVKSERQVVIKLLEELKMEELADKIKLGEHVPPGDEFDYVRKLNLDEKTA